MFTHDENGLRAAEEARRQAMLQSDTEKLGELLSERLVYTHSSGVKDSRQSYLHKLASGALRYETLEFLAPEVRLVGDVGLVAATMKATVSGVGGLRSVNSSYLAVWTWTKAAWALEFIQATALPAAAA